jgi:hypothetical protein
LTDDEGDHVFRLVLDLRRKGAKKCRTRIGRAKTDPQHVRPRHKPVTLADLMQSGGRSSLYSRLVFFASLRLCVEDRFSLRSRFESETSAPPRAAAERR